MACFRSYGTITYSNVVINDNPIIYLRLDEANTANGAVATNYGSLGTAGNGLYYSTSTGASNEISGCPGPIVNPNATDYGHPCAGFWGYGGATGSSNEVVVPYNAAALGSPKFTVEAWGKLLTASPPNYEALVSSDAASGSGYTLYAEGTPADWQFWMGVSSTYHNIASFTGGGASNTWQHIVGTYDGTNQKLYVNGFLVGTSAQTYTPNPSHVLQIGAGNLFQSQINYLFTTNIAEVAVYTNALTQAQILNHYVSATLSVQPQSVVMYAGGTANFTGYPNNSALFTYQWQSNNVNITGATSTLLTITNVQAANATNYQFIVSDTAGINYTSTVTLNVLPAPATNTYPGIIMRDQPVSYWRLGIVDATNGGSVPYAYDLAGGFNGTYSGPVGLKQPGAIPTDADSYSATFGTNNSTYAAVPFVTNLNSQAYTVECWAKDNGQDWGSYRAPLANYYPGLHLGYALYGAQGSGSPITSDWQLYLGVTTNWNIVSDTTPIVSNVWTHLAATCNGSNTVFYVNGLQVAAVTNNSPNQFAPNNAENLLIGCGSGNAPEQYWWYGGLGEVAVYNTVLSPSRIAAHYEAGEIPAFSSLTASPSAAYGTTSVTLSGKVSVPGPFYPPSGETITATINGNQQSTTISDSTGDFSINYNPSTIPASGTPYTISYGYAGDGIFNGVTNSATTLTINKASQTITFGAGATIAHTYGDAAFSDTATASSGLTVTYSSDTTSVATVNSSGTVTIVGAGTAHILANQSGNANYNAASQTSQTLTVNPLPVALAGTRAYDGTTNAVAAILSVANKVGGDTVDVASGTGGLAGSNVGPQNITSLGLLALGNNSAGDYTLTGYSGSVTITQAVASVSVGSSENPSGYKDSLSFTATLPTYATGSVLFLTNTVLFDTENLTGGTATSVATTLLPRGTDTITAQYAGNANVIGNTNSLSQVVTNHPPVAATMTAYRTAGTTLRVALSDMATNWSDVDGDTVELMGVNFTTTNGQTLWLLNVTTNSGSFVITNIAFVGYTNGPNVNDQYTYSIADGQGGTNIGLVNIVIVGSVSGTNSITMVTSGNPTALIAYGIPGYGYVAQRATNLVSPVWINISTNTAATNGVITVMDNFSDLKGDAPQSAYYRITWQP
jgi:hypothetical protein